MTNQQIADRLVALCRSGEYQTCYDELYSPEVVSIEADGSIVKGFEEMAAKGKEWNSRIEALHDSGIGDPVVGGSHFALSSYMNVTFKGAAGPVLFEEVCSTRSRMARL